MGQIPHTPRSPKKTHCQRGRRNDKQQLSSGGLLRAATWRTGTQRHRKNSTKSNRLDHTPSIPSSKARAKPPSLAWRAGIWPINRCSRRAENEKVVERTGRWASLTGMVRESLETPWLGMAGGKVAVARKGSALLHPQPLVYLVELVVINTPDPLSPCQLTTQNATSPPAYTRCRVPSDAKYCLDLVLPACCPLWEWHLSLFPGPRWSQGQGSPQRLSIIVAAG